MRQHREEEVQAAKLGAEPAWRQLQLADIRDRGLCGSHSFQPLLLRSPEEPCKALFTVDSSMAEEKALSRRLAEQVPAPEPLVETLRAILQK